MGILFGDARQNPFRFSCLVAGVLAVYPWAAYPWGNTAYGINALAFNGGSMNTAVGYESLYQKTTGHYNAALGSYALKWNTSGGQNTAIGHNTLASNMTGYFNTAVGTWALKANTYGRSNTAIGFGAGSSITTGRRNTALGHNAGHAITGNDNITIGNPGVPKVSNNIRIGTEGTHTRTFLAGVRGATTDIANTLTVLVDPAGQLGTASSSRRFKEDIQPVGEASDRLLSLRPVMFRYRSEAQRAERPVEFGLIAEEVADIFPELVVYDEVGRPDSVKYRLLSALLLNELQKEHKRNDIQEKLLSVQKRRLRAIGDENRVLRDRLTALEAQQARIAALEAVVDELKRTKVKNDEPKRLGSIYIRR